MKLNLIAAASLVVLSLSTAGCATMTELEGLLSTIPNVTVDADGIVRVVKKPQPLPSVAPTQNELVLPMPGPSDQEVSPPEAFDPLKDESLPYRRKR